MLTQKSAVTDSFLPVFHFEVSFVNLKCPNGAGGWKEEMEASVDMAFAEVTGIGAELPVEEVVDGCENHFVYRLPKPPKYKNLILKRALTVAPSSVTLWAMEGVKNFRFSPCSVLVSILDKEHKPVKTWSFKKAYPVKLEFSALNAGQGEIMIETLELAYHYSELKVSQS